MHYSQENNRLVCIDKGSALWIEPWGDNSLRVRMTKEAAMAPHDRALSENPQDTKADIHMCEKEAVEPWYRGEERKNHTCITTEAIIENGSIKAKMSEEGWITFYSETEKVLFRKAVEKTYLNRPLCGAAWN